MLPNETQLDNKLPPNGTPTDENTPVTPSDEKVAFKPSNEFEQFPTDGKKTRQLNVDEFLKEVGEFGPLQKLVVAIVSLFIFAGTYQVLIPFFLGINPSWRCTTNSTQCTIKGEIDSSHKQYTSRCSMGRASWEFTKSHDYSIVTEWDLICEKETYSILAKSSLFLGWLVGAVLFGELSSRYGRKLLMYFCSSCLLLFGFGASFATDFWTFFVLRLLVGFFQGGAVLTLYIMATENVGPRYRSFSGNVIWLAFTASLCLMGLQAYLVQQWRKLSMICSAPYLVFLLTYRFFPKSIKWLHIRGRDTEAMNILRKFAKSNKKHFPSDASLAPIKETCKHGSYADLVKSKRRFVSTILQFQAWVINAMVYYGITLASDQLGGSLYRDYVLSSVVELPAYLSCIYIFNALGRRKSTVISMLVAGACCIIVAFVPTKPQGLMWTRVGIGIVGKFFITLSFSAIYLWSSELYPTTIRSQGLSVVQIAGRLGSAGAPWVAQFLNRVHPKLPFLMMGGLACASGLMCLGLQETVGKSIDTQETNDDVMRITHINGYADGTHDSRL